MRTLPFLLLPLLIGCKPKHVDLEGELVEITPDAFVVDFKAAPGMRVDFAMTVGKDKGTLVPAEGKVRLKYPRSKWSGYYGDELELAASKYALGREKAWGSATVKMPALIKSFLRIEKDDSGLWFGALRVGTDKGEAGSLAFNIGDEELAARVPKDAKKVAIVAAAPIGAEVAIGSTKLEAEKPGIAEGDIPMRELALSTMLGEKPTIKLPVTVTKDDESAKFSFTLTPYTVTDVAFVNDLVAKELDALEEGKTFPTRPAIIEAVIVRTDVGTVKQLGKAGPVGDVHYVALEKATERTGASCAYNTFSKTIKYDDIDVRIIEARTGKEIAKKKFMAPYVSCPQWAMSDDYFVWQHAPEKIEEWITKTALGK